MGLNNIMNFIRGWLRRFELISRPAGFVFLIRLRWNIITIWSPIYNWLSRPHLRANSRDIKLAEQKIGYLTIFLGFGFAFLFTEVFKDSLLFHFKTQFFTIGLPWGGIANFPIYGNFKKIIFPAGMSIFLGAQAVILIGIIEKYSLVYLKPKFETVRFILKNLFLITAFLVFHAGTVILPSIVTGGSIGYICADAGLISMLAFSALYFRIKLYKNKSGNTISYTHSSKPSNRSN